MSRTVVVTILLLAPGLARAGLSLDANGWTILLPAPDTRTIYVSSSAGNDNNTGLSPTSPLATINKAKTLLRDNSADQLLLKRGDTFSESFGTWTKRGRSAEQPLVLGAYGVGARPLLKTGTQNGITVWSASLDTFSNIAITGLHFQADGNTGAIPSAGLAGIRWDRPGANLLVEDTVFERYATNIVVQSVDPARPFNNLTVRRSQILDSFANHSGQPGASHSSGLYTSNVRGVLIEENLLDHNGWNESIASASPTIYNHNLYIQTDSADVVVRDNIIARASSHGLQLRPGGLVDGNLFLDNSLGFFIAGAGGTAIDNVLLHGSSKPLFPDNAPRAWGIEMKDIMGSQAIRNLLAYTPGGVGALMGLSGVDAEGNVIYKWGAESTPVPMSDPIATLADYDRFLGGDGTLAHFLSMARLQSRDNWDADFTARNAIPYFFQSAYAVPEPGMLPLLIATLALARRRGRALVCTGESYNAPR